MIALSRSMPDEVAESSAHRPRRRITAILGFVTVAVAAMVVWFLTSQGSEPEQAGGANQVRSTLHLESFVINAADSDQRAYLRVGIDLGLNQKPKRAAEAAPVAQVRDTILGVLGEAKVGDLMTSAGKKKLKQDLVRALRERLPDMGVEEIYASAQVDQRKVGKLALAIQVAFQELGVFHREQRYATGPRSEPSR